ncbi:L,D-transpeptidase family protein [Streptacidiphilus sp. N1-3]|uniref:L,D-transpeptidase family protein n=1 Tax=Streptacidiphilus alkalitolerans TaxID=3342712 RepID=A0ABV6X5R4_9ACTN
MSSHPHPGHQPAPTDGYDSGAGGYGHGRGSYGQTGYDQGDYGRADYGQAEYGQQAEYGRGGYPQSGYPSGEAYGAPYPDYQAYQGPEEQVYGGPVGGYDTGTSTGYGYAAPVPDPGYAEQAGFAQQEQPGQQEQYGQYGQYRPYEPEAVRPESVYAAAPVPASAEPGRGAAPRTGSRAASRTGTRTQIRAAAKARARRKRRVRNGFLGVGSVAAVAVIAVAGFLHPEAARTGATAAAAPSVDTGRSSSAPADASRSVTRPTPTTALKQLPGLGASFLAKIPANAQQVFLVTGSGKNANTSTAVLYTRTADGSWLPGTAWAAHNAKDGWTGDHMAGDLHSPIGVFSLTDAGGLDPNPGTKLPYLHSSEFKAPGTGFEGESLADAFDYVIAINYNHDPGTSPLSTDRPMGASRGGGIWIHVDHGGPTHGCVSLAKANMATLLKDLDPAKHPVIVMGDAASLRA